MNARVAAAIAASALIAALTMGGAVGAAGGLALMLGGPTGGGGTSTDGRLTVVGATGQAVAGLTQSGSLKLDAGILAGQPARIRTVIPYVAHDP